MQGCLITPRFTTALEGCTARRILALGPELVESGVVKAFEQRDITAAEAKAASAEMFLCVDY
jgi:4-amino-4-deoxychorismate lyase|eukprot:COSAG06_NODE_5839_length_3249_cov_16.365079_3_plen_62_part_00